WRKPQIAASDGCGRDPTSRRETRIQVLRRIASSKERASLSNCASRGTLTTNASRRRCREGFILRNGRGPTTSGAAAWPTRTPVTDDRSRRKLEEDLKVSCLSVYHR